MFTLKLIKKSINNSCLAQRHVSIASGRALGFFKDKTETEVNEIAPIIDHDANDENEEAQIQRIDAIRNKSGLYPQHRNLLHGKVPYKSAESWVHTTLKYQRKVYGKYGNVSGVDPRICFWSSSELKEKQEYERVAFPKTVPEMMAINEQEKRERREKVMGREAQIEKNLEKLEQWKIDIEMRKDKKESEARIAKERKDRLIEEVRRHFGYTIDPRDERFKEMLELKEKEQRKQLKESKRQAKETKLMSKLIETNQTKGDQKKSEIAEEKN